MDLTVKHLVRRPSGIYYFRRRVPSDLTAIFSRQVIFQSLKTTDWNLAVERCLSMTSRCEDLIQELRQKSPSGIESTQIQPDELQTRLAEPVVVPNPQPKPMTQYMDSMTKGQNPLGHAAINGVLAYFRSNQQLVSAVFPQHLDKIAQIEANPSLMTRFANQIDSLIHDLLADGHSDSTRPIELSSPVLNGSGSSPIKLSEAFERMKLEKLAGDNWRPKTQADAELAIGYIIELLGDQYVSAYAHEDLLSARELIMKLPPNRMKKVAYRGLSLRECVQINDGPALSVKRVNELFIYVTSVFSWCESHEFLSKNPAKGLKLQHRSTPKDDRKSYSHDDLQRFMDAVIRTQDLA